MTNEENNNIYYKCLEFIEQNGKDIFIPRLIIDRTRLYDFEIYYIIFSHDFAKAFWGEGQLYRDENGRKTGDYTWEYHLSKMVLCQEPLMYLEKFL